jgi:hypothetical protein
MASAACGVEGGTAPTSLRPYGMMMMRWLASPTRQRLVA